MSQKSDANSLGSRIATIIGTSAWVLLGLFGLSLAILIPLMWLLPEPMVQYVSEEPAGMVLLNAIQYVITLTAVVGLPLLVRRASERDMSGVRKLLGVVGRLRIRDALLVLPVWLVYFVATLVVIAIASLVPGFNVDQAQDIGFKDLTSHADLILAFIGLVIMAPIAEELLFRGYLFGKIRAVNGFWVSALSTSLLFGFAHLQWNVGIDTFVLSLFLCWLREKTGSVWASILLHMLKNGIAYTFLFILGVQ